ncbi:hypothetical protein [Sulfitobacter sp.]|uniref:hypothetical protein n=1 Tax=Sulfitobacter sp. TaxID=1903071 RepID=UPI003EF4AE2C
MMKSRLETIDPDLATEIYSASLSAAKMKVREIFSEKLTNLPDTALRLLPKNFEIQSYRVSQGEIDALDDRYFDLEESGDAVEAAEAFMTARFLSAVMSWQSAGSLLDLCEAAYEANFAA